MLPFKNTISSKRPSDILFRLGAKMCPAKLNNLSTAADDGNGVLYLKKTFLHPGKSSSELMEWREFAKYSSLTLPFHIENLQKTYMTLKW